MAKVTIDELVTKYVFEVDPAGVRRYQAELEKSGVSAKRAAAAAERYATDAARANMKAAERAAKAQEDAAVRWAKANEKAAERVRKAAEKAARDQERAAAKASKSSGKGGGGLLGDLNWKEAIAGVATGALAFDAIKSSATAAVGAVVELGRSVIETGMNFESLRARLKTVEGSSEGAAQAFGMITDFAKRTPFEVEDITAAFTQLRVRGVTPTTESLTALGDLSSAFGYGFGEMTDAIGAAARGELDPIEKFGIAAKVAGDRIRLSFKGQTVEVDRSAKAVTDALVKFGQMSGVQGAMADQSATAAGMVSNLKDAISAFFDQVAQMDVMDVFKEILTELSGVIGGDNGLARLVADVLLIGLEAFRDVLQSIPQEGAIGFMQSLVSLLGLLVDNLMFAAQSTSGALIPALLELMTPILDAAVSIGELMQRLKEISEKIPQIPGPLKLLGAAVMVLAKAWGIMADMLEYIIGILDPFLDKMDKMASMLPDVSDVFGDLLSSAESTARAFLGMADDAGTLSGELSVVATAAALAREELERLEKQKNGGDMTGKTDAELQEIRKQGGAAGTAAEKEIAQRAKQREEQEKQDASRARREGQRTKGIDAALASNDPKILASLASDLTVPADKRAEAQKKLDALNSKKKGGRSKEPQATGLEAILNSQIAELSSAAEVRVSAQALEQGKPPDEAFKLGKEAAKQTEERIRTRFQETGELPIGISRDISQLARAPSVEESIGRVPPPVISVVNNVTNVTVSGNEFSTEVDAQLQGVTANELSREVSAATMKMVKTELGAAIQNVLPKVRV